MNEVDSKSKFWHLNHIYKLKIYTFAVCVRIDLFAFAQMKKQKSVFFAIKHNRSLLNHFIIVLIINYQKLILTVKPKHLSLFQ